MRKSAVFLGVTSILLSIFTIIPVVVFNFVKVGVTLLVTAAVLAIIGFVLSIVDRIKGDKSIISLGVTIGALAIVALFSFDYFTGAIYYYQALFSSWA